MRLWANCHGCRGRAGSPRLTSRLSASASLFSVLRSWALPSPAGPRDSQLTQRPNPRDPPCPHSEPLQTACQGVFSSAEQLINFALLDREVLFWFFWGLSHQCKKPDRSNHGSRVLVLLRTPSLVRWRRGGVAWGQEGLPVNSKHSCGPGVWCAPRPSFCRKNVSG